MCRRFDSVPGHQIEKPLISGQGLFALRPRLVLRSKPPFKALAIVALAAHVSVFKLLQAGAIGALVCIPPLKMALLQDVTLGIDFGTSNSAMSVRQGQGAARMISLEGDARTLPTALFFNAEEHRTHFGRDAIAQYLEGTEGRLMRSLKSLLGSALLQDKTAVHQQLISYQDVISLFLRMLAQKAQADLGGMPGRVVMGRPVHFVDDDPVRDQQAEDALRQAAVDAGFENISFQPEPIAAALDYEQRIDHEAVVLVVDIGGEIGRASCRERVYACV